MTPPAPPHPTPTPTPQLREEKQPPSFLRRVVITAAAGSSHYAIPPSAENGNATSLDLDLDLDLGLGLGSLPGRQASTCASERTRAEVRCYRETSIRNPRPHRDQTSCLFCVLLQYFGVVVVSWYGMFQVATRDFWMAPETFEKRKRKKTRRGKID